MAARGREAPREKTKSGPSLWAGDGGAARAQCEPAGVQSIELQSADMAPTCGPTFEKFTCAAKPSVVPTPFP